MEAPRRSTQRSSTMQTSWQLTLLYKGHDDPAIERDVRAIERAYAAFAKTYKKTAFTKSAVALRRALVAYERLAKVVGGGKPLAYFFYVLELNAEDEQANARSRLISDRLTKASTQITFFELAIAAIPRATQKRFLRDKRLARYAYFLARIFRTAAHNLSEAEENIVSRLSAPAGHLWTHGVEKALARREVTHRGKRVPLNEAMQAAGHEPDAIERAKTWKEVVTALTTVAEFSESEINALFTKKKTMDELRSFAHPYDATILGYENDPKSVEALVNAVTSAFPLAHRFYALKAKLLGVDTLTYADRSAPLPTTSRESYPFPKAVQLVREAFSATGERYAAILDAYLANGQIDVYPRKGKSGGAFCSSRHGLPTFVLLNHTDDFNAVLTLAHEMGHAIHGELSATQPIFYEDYSTAVAETASTFFETRTFRHISRTLSRERRIEMLHNSLQDEMATVFRQIACFSFEHALHETIRAEGWVSHERIAALLAQHMRAYLGPAVEVSDRDGYMFVAWSHIRRPFYVYSYAFGHLISRALIERVERSPQTARDVETFLMAGSRAMPEDIFASIGLNIRSARFWGEGLAGIERDIIELEQLLSTPYTH